MYKFQLRSESIETLFVPQSNQTNRQKRVLPCRLQYALQHVYLYFLHEIGLVSLQITIYDMDEDGADIDRAILRGLLKGLLTCMVYTYDPNSLPVKVEENLLSYVRSILCYFTGTVHTGTLSFWIFKLLTRKRYLVLWSQSSSYFQI